MVELWGYTFNSFFPQLQKFLDKSVQLDWCWERLFLTYHYTNSVIAPLLYTCSLPSCSLHMFSAFMFFTHVLCLHVLYTCSLPSCSLHMFSAFMFFTHVLCLHVLYTCSLPSCSLHMFSAFMFFTHVLCLHVLYTCSLPSCSLHMFSAFMFFTHVLCLHVLYTCSLPCTLIARQLGSAWGYCVSMMPIDQTAAPHTQHAALCWVFYSIFLPFCGCIGRCSSYAENCY